MFGFQSESVLRKRKGFDWIVVYYYRNSTRDIVINLVTSDKRRNLSLSIWNIYIYIIKIEGLLKKKKRRTFDFWTLFVRLKFFNPLSSTILPIIFLYKNGSFFLNSYNNERAKSLLSTCVHSFLLGYSLNLWGWSYSVNNSFFQRWRFVSSSRFYECLVRY